MFLRTIVSPRRLGGPSTFRFTRGVVPRTTADDRPRFPIVIRVVVALTVVVARIVVIVVIIESSQTKRRRETSNRKLKIPENRIVGVSARVEAKRSDACVRSRDRAPVVSHESPTRPSRCGANARARYEPSTSIIIDPSHPDTRENQGKPAAAIVHGFYWKRVLIDICRIFIRYGYTVLKH